MSLSIVLDSSAYSMLRRGRDEVLDIVAESSRILMPMTVLGELYAGFRLGQRFEDNRARLDEFLGEEGVELTMVDRSIAERYGQLFARLAGGRVHRFRRTTSGLPHARMLKGLAS